MSKALKILLIVLIGILVAGSVSAITIRVGRDVYWSTDLVPETGSSVSLGSDAKRVLGGYFDGLDTSTLDVGTSTADDARILNSLAVGTSTPPSYTIDVNGDVRVTATTTLEGNVLMQDDKTLYFNAAKDTWVRYDSGHGGLMFDSPYFYTYGELQLYTNVSGEGTAPQYYPSFALYDDGQIEFQGSGEIGGGGLLTSEIWIETYGGIAMRTGGHNRSARLLADNIGTSDRTFQFPNLSGTFLMESGTQDILTTGTLGAAATTITGNLTIDTSLTGILRADSGVVSTTSVAGDMTKAVYDADTNDSIDAIAGGTNLTAYIKGDTLYASATNTLGISPIGTDGQVWTASSGVPVWEDAAAGGASTALDNLADVAINTSLISDADSTDDLGSSSKYWANTYVDKVYLNATEYIYNNGNYFYFYDGSYEFSISLNSSRALFNTYGGVFSFPYIQPTADSIYDLGKSTHYWDETYTDELVLQNVGAGTTAADQTRLSGLDLSPGDAGLHIKTENDTEHLFASKVGIGTTTPDGIFVVATSSGASVFHIDSSGKVGIGTPTPDSLLHIKGNIPGTIGSHPAGQLIIQNPADNVWSNAVITGYESDGSGNPDQQLWYLGSASGSNSDIIFLNRRNSKLQLGTSGAAKMTILGDGNVGIGTSTPATALHVVGSSTISGNVYMQDDMALYFSTSKAEGIGYNSDIGEITFTDNSPTLVSTGNFKFYSNAGATGGGNWEPHMSFGTDGSVIFQNTSQGTINRFFKIGFTEGMRLQSGGSSKLAKIKADNIATTDKTFQFANKSGVFVTESNDTSSSTVTIGASNQAACLTLGDTDLGGVTYITALDGVLTATTTKPSICQ